MDNALLAAIQTGKGLKKAVTVDKSAVEGVGGIVGEAPPDDGTPAVDTGTVDRLRLVMRDALKAEWLTKYSVDAWFKNWRHRYVVLRNDRVTWHKTDDEKAEVRGQLLLTPDSTVAIEGEGARVTQLLPNYRGVSLLSSPSGTLPNHRSVGVRDSPSSGSVALVLESGQETPSAALP